MEGTPTNHKELLQAVQQGQLSVEEGLDALKRLNADDLGFAQIDHHRAWRQGLPEVVYCAGKTVEQSVAILLRQAQVGSGPLMGTRAPRAVYDRLEGRGYDFEYDDEAHLVVLRRGVPEPQGQVLAVSAGTADGPILREAEVTAELMGAKVDRLIDVGVAGLHRLLGHLDTLYAARVIIVAAGMDGALPSVIGGLVDVPVIAIPTSVGYGANFAGVAPLLTMLNSCAAGIGVVNIDNGFGAGYLAGLINRGGCP
ncbi:MAG: 1-(5-phosphoribosyl)-5-amino-4-imidazole-carboxylate carboxylase [Sulfobacillus thermosulfidooxidans]|nr:MAG: 1-(5-phosphoribosyl)-5-amino-4-imidazole-carboxylate carboxylase [Sulfobacillus thermosulfidooxidans]